MGAGSGKEGKYSVGKCVSLKHPTVLSDLQDVFRAMHLKLDIVKLYLEPLLIGELSPEEPSQERNKNVSEVLGPRCMWRDGDKSQLTFS